MGELFYVENIKAKGTVESNPLLFNWSEEKIPALDFTVGSECSEEKCKICSWHEYPTSIPLI